MDILCIPLTHANAIINEIISILVVMLNLGILTLDLDLLIQDFLISDLAVLIE